RKLARLRSEKCFFSRACRDKKQIKICFAALLQNSAKQRGRNFSLKPKKARQQQSTGLFRVNLITQLIMRG
ncbi:MAG: hypothetical protein IJD81_10280, partial [Oscillospiraceae bacterium]|nr:hypothetical protein [Oscillospiraceae bacterium]